MKEKYFAPEMEIIEVEVHQLLAGSVLDIDGNTSDASEAEAPDYEWSDWEF